MFSVAVAHASSRQGVVIAGPLYDSEGIVVADCDLRQALHAKRYFDVAGHYGRADVLTPRPQA
jgi:nitrilase